MNQSLMFVYSVSFLQAVLIRSVHPVAKPACVSSQASTTVTPVTTATQPSSLHGWCTTGTLNNERWAPQQIQIQSHIYSDHNLKINVQTVSVTSVCVSVQVSKKALWLLAQVQYEPLLNVEQMNPEVVEHSESMAQAHKLRQRLRLLGDYLLTCRSKACKQVQAKCVIIRVLCVLHFYPAHSYKYSHCLHRMDQRTYLLESSHLYSVMDLRQVSCWVDCVVGYCTRHLPA